jgi:chemotaxis signal transduction protein
MTDAGGGRGRGVQAIPFLLFELEGQRYGVAVDQVEAIVEAQAVEERYLYAGQEVPVRPFAGWIGLPAADKFDGRLLIGHSAEGWQGFEVGTPRDIITLPLEAIHPIPILVRRVLGDSPLWGVGRHADGLVLLVNLA